jgi:hypothetical protein
MPSFIRPTQPPAFHSAPELDLKIDYQNAAGSGGDPSQWFYGQHDPYIVMCERFSDDNGCL